MSLLIAVDSADFNYLKEKTESTAGNLSVQISKLEEAEYITIEKGYKGKRPQTICTISSTGKMAFKNYVTSLNSYINPQ